MPNSAPPVERRRALSSLSPPALAHVTEEDGGRAVRDRRMGDVARRYASVSFCSPICRTEMLCVGKEAEPGRRSHGDS
ncbi:hypothetical protein Z043_124934 [Scleropages formosus]|uniref:Uncharacterized protein n=1 Tax=Scleropages formosus TaxID=113540 RepID=A0A0P7W8V2_SCLFO|nr:hypothetical protein Z043_124934 [Scleropages formosus]